MTEISVFSYDEISSVILFFYTIIYRKECFSLRLCAFQINSYPQKFTIIFIFIIYRCT